MTKSGRSSSEGIAKSVAFMRPSWGRHRSAPLFSEGKGPPTTRAGGAAQSGDLVRKKKETRKLHKLERSRISLKKKNTAKGENPVAESL